MGGINLGDAFGAVAGMVEPIMETTLAIGAMTAISNAVRPKGPGER